MPGAEVETFAKPIPPPIELIPVGSPGGASSVTSPGSASSFGASRRRSSGRPVQAINKDLLDAKSGHLYPWLGLDFDCPLCPCFAAVPPSRTPPRTLGTASPWGCPPWGCPAACMPVTVSCHNPQAGLGSMCTVGLPYAGHGGLPGMPHAVQGGCNILLISRPQLPHAS